MNGKKSKMIRRLTKALMANVPASLQSKQRMFYQKLKRDYNKGLI